MSEADSASGTSGTDGRLETGVTLDNLFPRVYGELRALAASRLAAEGNAQTLQPTALVHETYIRLRKSASRVEWRDRRHFFGVAAESMRRILIEHARAKQSQKRGRNPARTELRDSLVATESAAEEILAVHEALEKFDKVDPETAEFVKLRYFGGLTLEESADALAMSRRTANRRWAYARAWLHRELEESSN